MFAIGRDSSVPVRKYTGAELSGHFGTSLTVAEISWIRSVLGLKCLDTPKIGWSWLV